MLACKRGLTFSVTSALRTLRPSNRVVVCGQAHRRLSTQTDGEVRIATVLKEKFPLASSLKVVDISGKRTVQQHQLVNQALKEEIQGMHGLRIFTEVPKQ
ncbi:putative bolA-like protein 3 isoform 3 [Scophthalmus maximus]|uniref:Putative bolA-like protein 3 isoform 3 n=1 Tax=Scophthalmus maximus TaxID=52904 RepID=A0A2U9BCP6_SCOMX|nr:putative bolA-like protein 3 isoform 3 [Scophthalmus maximus]